MNAVVTQPVHNNRLALNEEHLDRLGLVLDELLSVAEAGGTPDVEAACSREPELASSIRHYVRSIQLLHQAAHQGHLSSHAGSRLPDPGQADPGQADPGQADPGQSSPGAMLSLAAPTLRELGDYRLVREIGRGGMGIVYEAQQLSLARRVALKILPFAAVLDSRQIMRFQNEAQAAASLHHPHIVPVFAVGNERGTHYYSMQYIDGQSLDYVIDHMRHGRDGSLLGLHIDQWQLTLRNAPTFDAPQVHTENWSSKTESMAHQSSAHRADEVAPASASTLRMQANASTVHTVRTREYVRRVAELGMQAADALHHAHEHGIVHRDIKPSNLMLDGTGKLWITDFGLAQCSSPGMSSSARMNLTRSGDFLGTLRYMSPEQASGKPHLVDQRSDIYSLGATLYELLTLQPVVQSNDRLTMARHIEQESPRAPRRINHAVPADLENIVLKTLSKSRDDRYASASELSADLQRYLSGQTPLAKRPSPLDRAARSIRRHSHAVAAICAVLFVLLCGSAIAAVILRAKNIEIAQANDLAEHHLTIANEAVYRFGPSQLRRLELLPGSESMRADLARQALDYFQRFADYADNNHSMANDVAHAQMICGDLELQLGNPTSAVQHFRSAAHALAELSQSARADSRSIDERHAKLWLCRNNLAVAIAREGNLDTARQELEHALASMTAHSNSAVADDSQKLKCSMLLHLNLGAVYRELREVHSAENEFTQVIQLAREANSDRLSIVNHEEEAAGSRNGATTTTLSDELSGLLCAALLEAGQLPGTDYAQSGALLELAMRTAQQLAIHRAAEPLAQHDLCLSRLALGAHALAGGDRSAARVQIEQATTELRKLASAHPAVMQFSLDLASGLNNLGQVELELRALPAAELAFDEARQLLERQLTLTSDYLVASSLGGVCNNLAMVSEAQGQMDLAEQLLRRAIAYQEQALHKSPDSSSCAEFLAEHLAQLSRLLKQRAMHTQSTDPTSAADVQQLRRH